MEEFNEIVGTRLQAKCLKKEREEEEEWKCHEEASTNRPK